MSVSLYDEALLNKLKSWTQDTKMQVFGVNDTKRLFEVIADKTNDRPIQLPIIALSRPAGYTILNTNKRVLTFDGYDIEKDKKRSLWLNAIPIQIDYQLDLYTRYLKESDEYMRNLVFNIINFPRLQITVPYMNANLVMDSNIRIQPNVIDNSSVPERLVSGQFTRVSLNMYIDDAYLYDVRSRDNYIICPDNVDIDFNKE